MRLNISVVQVLLAKDGTAFVSDGYCNPRVARFTKSGQHMADYQLQNMNMVIPHSIVLDDCAGLLLVADREHGRVHQFEVESGKHTGDVKNPHMKLMAESDIGSVPCTRIAERVLSVLAKFILANQSLRSVVVRNTKLCGAVCRILRAS